jgi:hypothetical protein
MLKDSHDKTIVIDQKSESVLPFDNGFSLAEATSPGPLRLLGHGGFRRHGGNVGGNRPFAGFPLILSCFRPNSGLAAWDRLAGQLS